MMYKVCSRIAACAAVFLLSACGGGGGGGSLTSTPPPPPPPTTASYDSFPLTDSATFNPTVASRDIQRGGVFNILGFGVHAPNSNASISYDAASGSYTYSDGDVGDTFSAATRSTSGYFDTYEGTKSSATLTVFDNVRSGASQAGAPIKLSYLSFGNFRYDDPQDSGVLGLHLEEYFLFGYPTQTSDMPKSGSATYSTAVFADTTSNQNDAPITSITGSATFTANFGTGAVDTALTLPFAHSGSDSSTYEGSGSISGNQFSGDFTSSDDPAFNNGSFDGGFFGPAAQEMGYTFAISRGAADPYAGATAQPPLSLVVGAVVGTKQ